MNADAAAAENVNIFFIFTFSCKTKVKEINLLLIMTTPQQDKPQEKTDQIDLIDINVTQQSVTFLTEMANQANKKGMFELQDAFKIMLSLNNISKSLDTLNKLQNLALQKVNDTQEKQKQVSEQEKQLGVK